MILIILKVPAYFQFIREAIDLGKRRYTQVVLGKSPFFFKARPLLECLYLTFRNGLLAEVFYSIVEKPTAKQALCLERGLCNREA